MNLEARMNKVVREIRSEADSDPDWDIAQEIKRNINKYGLNKEEKNYLCKFFNILPKELK